jgi:hypothetical protein
MSLLEKEAKDQAEEIHDKKRERYLLCIQEKGSRRIPSSSQLKHKALYFSQLLKNCHNSKPVL